MTLQERFESKVLFVPPAACHYWDGYTNPSGNNIFWKDGRNHQAQRVAYELYVDEVPSGCKVVHTCGNTECVNPDHLALQPVSRSLKERFEQFVNKSGDCHVWTGSFKPVGYGQISDGRGRVLYAHRTAYELYVGPIPEGMFVLHRCDNRACVNPEHLFLGTHLENVEDMIDKNRQTKTPGPKLSEDEAVEIYQSHLRYVDLAEKYDVSLSTISSIKCGYTWNSATRHKENGRYES